MSRGKWAIVLAACIVLAAVAAAYAAGQAEAPVPALPAASEWEGVYSSAGMERLAEVTVLVADMNPEFCQFVGVSKQDIRTQTELYLRRVPGLRMTDNIVAPCVWVNITGMVKHSVDGAPLGYVANVGLELRQTAIVYRYPKQLWLSGATTWDASYVISSRRSEGAEHVRSSLRDLLDQFQNEYLRANPQIRASGAAAPPSEPGSR